MSYRVAAIDIHKKVLMVVAASGDNKVKDPAGEALEFEARRFGTGNAERAHVAALLQERSVLEVVMESTAQYWKPVWMDLEPHFPKLHLALTQELIDEWNPKLRGWGHYYQRAHVRRLFTQLDA